MGGVCHVHGVEQLVPYLEHEPRVERLVLDRDCVVQVVLERSIDDRVVARQRVKLKSPVKVGAVAVEEGLAR